MDENWTQLEADIDAQLAALADQLNIAAPREVLDRTRVCVRVALDEQWLDAQLESAAPHPAAQRRLRAVVRQELGAGRSPGHPPDGWVQRNIRGLAALSAAAMLGLCVGVIQYAASRRPAEPGPASDDFEAFLTSASRVYEVDPLTASLDEELQQLEESVTQWPSDHDDIETGLQNLEKIINELQADPDDDML